MFAFCSLEAGVPQRQPEHSTLAGMPITIWIKVLQTFLESEVKTLLSGHLCDPSAPCLVLKKVMRRCLKLLLVCKTWRNLIYEILQDKSYSKLRPTSEETLRSLAYGSSVAVAYRCSLGGRFRAYEVIEEDYDKCVVSAYDYGGTTGCRDKAEVVIKVSNFSAQYESEKDVYSWLSSSNRGMRNVPQFHFAGEYGYNSGYYGLVIDKLGPDLERLRLKCRRQRFPPRLTMAVAIQMVRAYQRLHSQGWLHCNAKPGNFAVGRDMPGRCNRLFIFDFEHAQRIEPNPQAKKVEDCYGWNCLFKPTTWEMHITPSRQDDLEGLGYVLSYLERGSHPWEYASPGEMWRIKICTPSRRLFEGMDSVYVSYFNYIKTLAWGEIPDYEGIIRQFKAVWEKRGFKGSPEDIDWWEEFGLRLGEV